MKKLLTALAILVLTAPFNYSSATSEDSITLSYQDAVQINLAYDSLRMYQNLTEVLEGNLVSCEKSLDAATRVIKLQVEQKELYEKKIVAKDSIIDLRGLQSKKYLEMYRNQRKKTIRVAIGCSIGGFVVGFTIPTVIFLLHGIR